MHPRFFALYFFTFFFVVVIAALMPAGCTKSGRQSTINTMLIATKVSRDAFTTWDLAHQRSILAAAKTREELDTKLGAYREKQDRVRLGFELVFQLIADAAVQNSDPSLKKATDAYNSLLEDVKTLKGPGPDVPVVPPPLVTADAGVGGP